MRVPYTNQLTHSGWKNLKTHLEANSYTGDAKVKHLVLINNSSTAAYFHIVADGSADPGTANVGLPFSTDTSAAPAASLTLEDVDLALCFVNTAGSIAINYCIW